MIARMKRIFLVFLERDKAENLKKLRGFGMVHLETIVPDTQGYEQARKTRETLLSALNIVPVVKKGLPEARLTTSEAEALADEVLRTEEQAKDLRAKSAAITRELERIAPWGEFEPSEVAALRTDGLDLAFYECEPQNLARLPEETEFVVLSRSKKGVRFAVVGENGPALRLPPEFGFFSLPQDSAAALKTKLAAVDLELAGCATRNEAAALEAASLKRAVQVVDQEISMEVAASSFAQAEALTYIKGYVPEKNTADLVALCRSQDWAILCEDPIPEDSTPTKVENNAVVRMIQPVMDFLGIVPGYREYEISNWFLLFFTLFTAMIFGDGAYGAILLVVSLLLALKSKRAGKAVSDFGRLFILLSSATLIWGMATATWFAIPPKNLPPFLLHLSIWPISGANPQSSQNIQVFCFAIGLVHLLIAHVKNIIRDRGSLKFLAQVGSAFMLIGMFFFVLSMVVNGKRFPAPGFALWFVLGGFALNFVFAAYDGSVLKSALEGLKNIIPNFLGAVGVFADIVSYIRLWAVGLAGTSLASIINQMGGGMMKGVAMAFAGLTLLLVGHSLNLVLSVLSIIVHGVRLNTLEFSNHLGMEWSGIKYDPFRVTFHEE
jgi:V/A-type H+/Na+-transporting ATPase subunit I